MNEDRMFNDEEIEFMKKRDLKRQEAENHVRAAIVAQVCDAMQSTQPYGCTYEHEGEFLYVDDEKIHVNEFLENAQTIPMLFDYVPDLVIEALQEMKVIHDNMFEVGDDAVVFHARMFVIIANRMFRKPQEWPVKVPMTRKQGDWED